MELIVDEDTAEILKGRKLYTNGLGYWQIYDNGDEIRIHHLVAGKPFKGFEVDHINGNRSDCRSENLRIVTHHQNLVNTGPRAANTSGYKGVTWCKANKSWRAQLGLKYKCKYLGYYKSKEEAARAYNKAAIEYFGETAYLNPV